MRNVTQTSPAPTPRAFSKTGSLIRAGRLTIALRSHEHLPCLEVNANVAAMTVIEIKPHRWGWRVFEAPGVEPFACARRAFFTQPRWEVVLDRLRKISPSDVFGG